jgi:hypothetical protein
MPPEKILILMSAPELGVELEQMLLPSYGHSG